jgi:hypothetical protein
MTGHEPLVVYAAVNIISALTRLDLDRLASPTTRSRIEFTQRLDQLLTIAH